MYVTNAIIAYTTYSKKFNEAHIVLLHEAGSTDNTFLYHPINLHQALVENLIWYSTCPYIKEDKFCRNEHAFIRYFWFLKNTFFFYNNNYHCEKHCLSTSTRSFHTGRNINEIIVIFYAACILYDNDFYEDSQKIVIGFRIKGLENLTTWLLLKQKLLIILDRKISNANWVDEIKSNV